MKRVWILISAIAAIIALLGLYMTKAPGLVILPHALSKDGTSILNDELRATDYASILLGYTWVAKKAVHEEKEAKTQTLVELFKSTENLFITNGSVIEKYVLEDGKYKRVGAPNIKALALLAYAVAYLHHSAMEGDLDPSWYATIKYAPYLAIQIAVYSLDNMYDSVNGGWYKTVEVKETKTIEDQAYGLLALQPLAWLAAKHPERMPEDYQKEDLEQIALQVDDLLIKVWSDEYGVYADTFSADGSNAVFNETKYDLRTIGYLLWGHAVLYDLLKDDYPARAAAIQQRALHFLETVFVNDTYKVDIGVPREIKVVNGLASVSRDEVNTGRLFDAVYALYQMQKTIESDFAKSLCNFVVLGAKNMHDEYALIHDYKFSDPTEISPIKETPYLGAYMSAAGVCWDFFTEEEKQVVKGAMLLDFRFLRDVVAPNFRHLSFVD